MRHKSLSKQTDEKNRYYNLNELKTDIINQTMELLGKFQNCFFINNKTSEGWQVNFLSLAFVLR